MTIPMTEEEIAASEQAYEGFEGFLPAYSPLRLVKEVRRLQGEVAQLAAQLPNEMKHCTIIFKECKKGHGRLTATNWVEHDCRECEIARLQGEIAHMTAASKLTPALLPDCMMLAGAEPCKGYKCLHDNAVAVIKKLKAEIAQLTATAGPSPLDPLGDGSFRGPDEMIHQTNDAEREVQIRALLRHGNRFDDGVMALLRRLDEARAEIVQLRATTAREAGLSRIKIDFPAAIRQLQREARAAAIEEAAQICHEMGAWGLRDCIRALADKSAAQHPTPDRRTGRPWHGLLRQPQRRAGDKPVKD